MGKESQANEVFILKYSLGIKCTESAWENKLDENALFNSRCDRHNFHSPFHVRAVWFWHRVVLGMRLRVGVAVWMLLLSNWSTPVITLTHRPACQYLQSSLRWPFHGSYLILHNLDAWNLHFHKKPSTYFLHSSILKIATSHYGIGVHTHLQWIPCCLYPTAHNGSILQANI